VSAGRLGMLARRIGRLMWVLALPGLLVAGGCAGSAAVSSRAKQRGRMEARDTRIVHEDCPVTGAGASAEDINGDGRPDRRTHSEAARVRCSTLDFDFDGAVEAWLYLDEAGKVRRRENDYDRDGSADEVSIYSGGVLVERQRSTVQAGKLDTWHYFSAGKLARTERDSNGDDYIDQWWEYPAPRTSDCPLIHSDVDGDGRPDPGATVDVCGDGSSANAETDASGAPPTGISEAPTEVESDPAGPGKSGGAAGASGDGAAPSPPPPGASP
jgi:hypothetical protein